MGEGTDVVSKEMYEFRDKGDRHLALRPEGTASVVRAFVQLRPPVVWKAWYVTPAFRYERPQAGRYRQHHQLGVEALGTDDPDLDVEVVALASRFFAGLGLSQVELKVNSMGDAACRPAYIESLRGYLEEHQDELCDEHRERYAANPLRVLDCKDEACVRVTADAPRLLESLCGPCTGHFGRLRAGLDALGVDYTIDHRLVRGFDYYTRTAKIWIDGTLAIDATGIPYPADTGFYVVEGSLDWGGCAPPDRPSFDAWIWLDHAHVSGHP